MKETRQRHGDKSWDRWDRNYLSQPGGEPEEKWMANVFVPFTLSTVLAILSELTEQNLTWKVMPQTSADEKQADTIQVITDFTKEKGNWNDEAFNADYDKLIYGTSVWKEYYREDRRVIKEPKYDKEGNLIEVKEKDIREFSDVYGKRIPLRNFYLDDKALSMREARDCVERNIMDIYDFRMRYAKYRNSKKVREWGFMKPSISENDIQNIPEGGDLNEDGLYIPTSLMKDHEIEVLEYWNRPRDMHVIIANGIVVVDEPIPYWHKQLPYVLDVCIPRPNSAYGMGVPEVLESSQEEMNTYHNLMLDTGKISLRAPVLVGGMTILDEDEYVLRPGGLIPVEDVTQAKPMPVTNILASHFQMYEEIKQTARVATGLDVRFAESTSPEGSDTATEVLRLQASSLRRIGLLSKHRRIHALPRLGMLRSANIQQFYQDPLRVDRVLKDGHTIAENETTGEYKLKPVYRQIRVKDDTGMSYNFQEIKPEDVRGNVDIYVEPQASEDLSEAVIAKRINTILQTIVAFPPMLQIVDLPALLRHYFKQIDLPYSIVKDVLSEPEADFDLAAQEDEAMRGGKVIPPTPNPTPQHTAVHAASIFELDANLEPTGQYSASFNALPQDVQEVMIKHYEGELETQQLKGEIPGNKGRTPTPGGTGTQQTVANAGAGEDMQTQF